jgi:predicted ferric reductase
VLILVGTVAAVYGVIKSKKEGIEAEWPTIVAGVVALMAGTVEVTLREHLSGYRSHTIMLASIPTLAFHSAIVLGASAFTRFPPLWNVALFAVDLGLWVVLYRLLRHRFLDARARRVSGRSR